MKRAELTGKRNGSITVVSPMGVNKAGRSLWKCRCDCGQEYVSTSATLRTARSCKRCALAVDITGYRFGKLIVLSHQYDEKKRHSWICRCDCGNVAVYSSHSLRQGRATTCQKCPRNTFAEENGMGIGITAGGEKFLFDLDDWDEVTKRTWHRTSKGYIVSDGKGARATLHRMVTNAPEGTPVDHINRNKSDCRKRNLRLATNALNSANACTYGRARTTSSPFLHSKRWTKRL